MDFPYKAEYAKSSRASCKGCKSTIGQDTLRLAALVQSSMFDGKMAKWYHHSCFFSKQRPKSTDEIEGFSKLRLKDQEFIKGHVGQGASAVVPEKKGKKRDATAAAAKNAALKDFRIEYAKSGRAICRGCEQKILKDEVRIAKKDFSTEVGMMYGGQDLWHHLSCFSKLRSELGYFESADKLPGFKQLKKNDQKEAKEQIPAIKQEDIPEVKKPKLEDDVDGVANKKEEKEYAAQNKIFFKNRDSLDPLKKAQLVDLLENNNQDVPSGIEEIKDLLADIMTFGCLASCKACKEGQLYFNGQTYNCKGNLTEWTKCNNTTDDPERFPFKVPKELAAEFSFLKKYKYVPRKRIIISKPSSTIVKKEEDEVDAGPKIQRELPPLYEMQFVIFGNPQRGKDELKTQITKLGGKVTTKISKSVMALIASKEDVEKMGARIQAAQEEDVHVIPEDFVDEVADYKGKIPELIIKKSICDWGSDPNTRLPPEPTKSSVNKSKSGSMFTKSMPSKVKLKLKGGLAVDPDSNLEHVSHVYCSKEGDKYTTVLGRTDIQSNKNSYYKLQLLEADSGNKYWLFRSWGRIGTTIGGNKAEAQSSLHTAQREFERLYEEKTGNPWYARSNFQKLPGLMYPIDIDYGSDEVETKLDIQDGPSKLHVSVQNLMKLIFDVKTMEKVMMELELDTEKMPLGKLSKSQLQQAFKVLNEIQNLIQKQEKNQVKFIDASNRFYTLVPHSFGVNEPIVINDEELIKQKVAMIESLMEMEIACNLMKSSGSEHTVDSYYGQLKVDIDVLAHDHEHYAIIEKYVKNTHAATHSSYELVIEDIYIVKRHGESKRFKPFKKLHNRKLLWHGSRTTNFAGILSQGLRIAPPEAPVTGYMFGKGIYFADMVSKSANYCCTSPVNPKGLLMLCEVALGEMYERTHSEYVEKLPKGKHSTKGIGKTEPDPGEAVKIEDDIEVPLGQPVTDNKKSTSLLYNEYIVYDVAQVQARFLVKTHFKYKY